MLPYRSEEIDKWNISSVDFISLSGLGMTDAEYTEFSDGNPPFTWGDLNLALVAPVYVMGYMKEIGLATSEAFQRVSTLHEFNLLNITNPIYIDLEN